MKESCDVAVVALEPQPITDVYLAVVIALAVIVVWAVDWPAVFGEAHDRPVRRIREPLGLVAMEDIVAIEVALLVSGRVTRLHETGRRNAVVQDVVDRVGLAGIDELAAMLGVLAFFELHWVKNISAKLAQSVEDRQPGYADAPHHRQAD